MKQTPNLGLSLPEESDWAEVATLNENWDKVDKAVAKKADLGENGEIVPEQLPIYAQFSGASAMGKDCFGGPLFVNNIQGNTVLGGFPSYENPVSIEITDNPIVLNVAKKNLVNLNKAITKSGTIYGVSYQVDAASGTIALSGTP